MNFEILECNEHYICATIESSAWDPEETHFLFAIKRQESVDIQVGLSLSDEITSDICLLVYRYYYPGEVNFDNARDFVEAFLQQHSNCINDGFRYLDRNYCV